MVPKGKKAVVFTCRDGEALCAGMRKQALELKAAKTKLAAELKAAGGGTEEDRRFAAAKQQAALAKRRQAEVDEDLLKRRPRNVWICPCIPTLEQDEVVTQL